MSPIQLISHPVKERTTILPRTAVFMLTEMNTPMPITLTQTDMKLTLTVLRLSQTMIKLFDKNLYFFNFRLE